MNQFILKDIDISILDLLYLRDVFNLTLTNKYFKLLCDDVLHDNIMNAKNSVKKYMLEIADNNCIELRPSLNHTLDMYQHLILLTIKDGKYELKNFYMYELNDIYVSLNGVKYHLSIWFDDHNTDTTVDVITADFDKNTIRNFLRHAFYDGLIIHFNRRWKI